MAFFVKERGITLAELMIVFTLMVVMATSLLATGAYFSQTKKAYDTKTKMHLDTARKIMEEFYNDHNRYPTVAEVGYTNPSGQLMYVLDTQSAVRMCGSKRTDEAMKSYVAELPCNSESPGVDYIYFNPDSQTYAIFTKLNNIEDPGIKSSGCEYGCSYYTNPNNPTGSFSAVNVFNYKVNSLGYNGNCGDALLVAY